ncbi:MAG: hypothetical protein ACI80L_002942, partial [Pseudohongiellaceae bacterium]
FSLALLKFSSAEQTKKSTVYSLKAVNSCGGFFQTNCNQIAASTFSLAGWMS